MKKLFFFVLMLTQVALHAQPLKLSPATITRFSQSLKAKCLQDAGWKNDLSGRLQKKYPGLQLQQVIDNAAKSTPALNDVMCAVFMKAGAMEEGKPVYSLTAQRDAMSAFLTSLKLSPIDVIALTGYSLYAYGIADAQLKKKLHISTPYFLGTKKFIDYPDPAWYSIVTILSDQDILVKSYPAEQNNAHKDKNKPASVDHLRILKGHLANAKGTFMGGFIYKDGLWAEANNEGTYNTYFECTADEKLINSNLTDIFMWIEVTDYIDLITAGKSRDEAIAQVKRHNNYEDFLIVDVTIVPMSASVKLPEPREKQPQKERFSFVEEPPVFPGGEDSLKRYLFKNLKYPKGAEENHLQGPVYVQFVIGKDGVVYGVKTGGLRLGGGLEEEAIRVIAAMPKWKPGKQDGQKTEVLYTARLTFSLTE